MPLCNAVANGLLSVSTALMAIRYLVGSGRFWNKWLFLASTCSSIAALTSLLLSPISIYGSIGRSCALVGIGLIWSMGYLFFRGIAIQPALIGLTAAFAASSWLMGIDPNLPTLFGFCPVLAQMLTCLGLCWWLCSAVQAFTDQPCPHLSTLAFMFEAAGSLVLAFNALVTWGQVFNWDPLESWWLFACLMAGIAVLGERHGWSPRVVALVGGLPAILTWFASWSIIQALHLSSIYLM